MTLKRVYGSYPIMGLLSEMAYDLNFVGHLVLKDVWLLPNSLPGKVALSFFGSAQ